MPSVNSTQRQPTPLPSGPGLRYIETLALFRYDSTTVLFCGKVTHDRTDTASASRGGRYKRCFYIYYEDDKLKIEFAQPVYFRARGSTIVYDWWKL